MALIICTSLPLACVAGVLAWHTYLATSDNSFERARADALSARREIANEFERVQSALRTLAKSGMREATADQAFQLVQSIDQNRYCALILSDGEGRVVVPSSDKGRTKVACLGGSVPIFSATKAESSPSGMGRSPSEATVSLSYGEVPLARAHIKVSYVNSLGETLPGELIALRPLIKQDVATSVKNSRSPTDLEPETTDLWLFKAGAPPVPLEGSQKVDDPWSTQALKRLDQDLREGRVRDHFQVDDLYYTLVPGYGDNSIVAVSVRSFAETRALHLFLARVALIVLILVVELLLVALAAQRYLVEPLEKLAFSVAVWRKNGKFQPDLPKSLPLEIRQMERAFDRATRRLDRHEARLQRAAKQQDLLIKEIHHRVKNNLQIVASLLNLQANRIKLPEAREEFHLVRDRVRSLATLHRHLYPEGGLSALDIRAFLEELASQIFTANNRINRGRISLSLDVENVPVTPDQAVPLALIVTEVVTNALRYAFPDERRGAVAITLSRNDDMAILTLRDDGVGLSHAAQAEKEKREGIGLQLVRGFARQLSATLDISSEAGTEYRLVFPVPITRRALT
ncbi:sensor histidine kinase [Asaia astilbis]|uniref:sensor histidine kinase n=1 Tax=Asaia astilbis TaxID=610244 RepID=UPI000687B6B1|nr:sensor histidine kinase [Asaia astilbis]